jgi:hypothetical protein
VAVLQVFRVVSPFSARALDRQPLWMERFELGEFLVALTREDADITFCRHDETTDLDDRSRFIVTAEKFDQLTEAL